MSKAKKTKRIIKTLCMIKGHWYQQKVGFPLGTLECVRCLKIFRRRSD